MNKEEVSTVLERETGYHVLMDSSLKSQTKNRLVWLVRILENNWANAELSLSQQAENVKDWEPVKHGHWVDEGEDPNDSGSGNHQYLCSCCEHRDLHSKGVTVPHCWFCGAKMDEVSDGEI